MQKICFLFAVFALAGCGTTMSKMEKYQEPQSGPTAEVAGYGNLDMKGLTKTRLEVFTGCFSGRDYSKENVLGRTYFKREELGKKTVKIPAGSRLYFKYGTNYLQWDCQVPFSFVPLENHVYKFDYERKFGGCTVFVTDITENPKGEGVDLIWYKPKSMEHFVGNPQLDWRKCDRLMPNQ